MSENSPLSHKLNNGNLKGLAIDYNKVPAGLAPVIVPPGLIPMEPHFPPKPISTEFNPMTSNATEASVWGIKKPLFGINRTVESIPQPTSSSFGIDIPNSPMKPPGATSSSWNNKNLYDNKMSEMYNSRGFEDLVEQRNPQPVGKRQFDPSAHFTSFVPRGNTFSGPQTDQKSGIAEGIIADEVMEVDQQTSEDVIADIKQQLESLICAVMLTATKPQEVLDSSVLQGADAIEVSHRIMTRMKMLRDENKRLYKLANGSSLAQMESTVAHLEKENAALRKYIKDHY